MSDTSILITRPKGDEIELTDLLHEGNFRVIHEPLTEIMLHHESRYAVLQALQNEPDAFIVTSRHGAQALALLTELRDMFVLCVGEATADAAMSVGFTRVSACGGTSEQMADYICDAYDAGSRFCYISGEHVSSELASMLPTMEIERIVGYEAIAAEELSDTLTEQLRRGYINGITFMSPRAASIFMVLITKAGLRDAATKIQAICLSEAVAAPLYATSWLGIHVAKEPTLASLVACVDNTFNNSRSSYV